MISQDEHVGDHPKILKTITFTVSKIIKTVLGCTIVSSEKCLEVQYLQKNIRPMENIPTNQ